jgi:hypothetical protein
LNRHCLFFLEQLRGTLLFQQPSTRHKSRNQTGHAILGPTRSRNFQPCHSPHFMSPLYPPNICRAKAVASSAPVFFTCRVACSLDHFPRDSDHIPPPLPVTVTAAFVPSRGHTALHRPAPSGARAGHGPPGHLPIGSGRFGVPLAHLAQADSDPFPGHIPARLRPL